MAHAAGRSAVLLLGLPGAGKSTVAQAVVRRPGAFHLAASAVLKAYLDKDPRARREWPVHWARGENAPDTEVLPLLWRAYAEATASLVVLDGYPRTRAQLHDFWRRGGALRLAVLLRVAPRTAAVRVRQRGQGARTALTSQVEQERMRYEAERLNALCGDPRLRECLVTVDAELPIPNVVSAIEAAIAAT